MLNTPNYHPDNYSRLENYIIEDVKSKDNPKSFIKEVLKYGLINGCHSGLTSYYQTGEFFKRFEDEIEDHVWDCANRRGISYLHFISTLNGAKDVGSNYQLKNLLVWFVYEDLVYRLFYDFVKGEK